MESFSRICLVAWRPRVQISSPVRNIFVDTEFYVEHVWNVMAHAQKPDLVFQRNGRVHLNGRGVSSVDYWQPSCVHQR